MKRRSSTKVMTARPAREVLRGVAMDLKVRAVALVNQVESLEAEDAAIFLESLTDSGALLVASDGPTLALSEAMRASTRKMVQARCVRERGL
jgi:hypothetical protein